jgi:hypothetical protein
VEPEDYYNGYWLTSMRDTDKALLGFFEECIKSSSLCPIANFCGPETTAQGLVEEINSMLQELLDDPRHLPADLSPYPWKQPPVSINGPIKNGLLYQLYRPYQLPILADELSHYLVRNLSTWENSDAQGTSTQQTVWNEGADAFHGSACSDARYRVSSAEDMYSLAAGQQAVSSLADGFYIQTWPCAQWKMEPAERYEGL